MMFRGTLRLVGAETILAGSLIGCKSATDNTDLAFRVSIQTSNTVRIEQVGSARRVTLPVTITNTSTETVYFSSCSSTVEKYVDGSWALAWTQLCLVDTVIRDGSQSNVSEPFGGSSLAPGASASLVFQPYDFATTFGSMDLTHLAPKYRVNLSLFIAESQFRKKTLERVPSDFSVSNEFTITN